jgi:hypothetical protein
MRSCDLCPTGWKKGNEDQVCLRCKKGESTDIPGANVCNGCDFGKYGIAKGNCTSCPVGQYQDEKYKTDCKTCTLGQIPNEGKTACARPDWKIVTDCDEANQYLNKESNDTKNHTCEPCPLGASCDGYISWASVKAKHGWWRLHDIDSTNPEQPPLCLQNYEGVKPPCAFSKCLYPRK